MEQAQYYTVPDITKKVPGNPSVQTVYRWILKGCRGVKLAHRRAGKRIVVTRQDLDEFMVKLAAAWDTPQEQSDNVTGSRKQSRQRSDQAKVEALAQAERSLEQKRAAVA